MIYELMTILSLMTVTKIMTYDHNYVINWGVK